MYTSQSTEHVTMVGYVAKGIKGVNQTSRKGEITGFCMWVQHNHRGPCGWKREAGDESLRGI